MLRENILGGPSSWGGRPDGASTLGTISRCYTPRPMASAGGAGAAGSRRVKKALEFVYYSTLRAVRGLFGLHTALKTPDRLVLDRVILPALAADPEYRRVIFVGCDWYTQHYEGMFAGRDYWTIDMDP